MNATIEQVLELLTRIAAGEDGVRGEPTGEEPALDAILVGLNMLVEELEHERAVRASVEALLADELAAYDASPAFLLSVDAATLTILKCNLTLARALGVAREALLGRPVVSLFAPADRDVAAHALAAAARGERFDLPELSFVRDHGELRVSTALSHSDEPPRLRLVCRDVSRERRLEHELAQAQKMQAMGRVAAGIAHDFNNLLAVVLAGASLVRRGVGPDSPLSRDLGLIQEAAQRGGELTSQLLSFSRQQPVSPRPVEVGLHLRELDRMMRRIIPESVSLSLYVPDEDVVVQVDPVQLTQVVMNLVVNARDALPGPGSILVELQAISVDGERAAGHLELAAGEYALLCVSDTGRGMANDVLIHAFEPFFTTKPTGEGTGLGLSVCYGIVRQAGGHIYIYSEVGEGTTVKVYLPRVAEKAAAREVPSSAAPTGTETLLCVEDDDLLRSLTCRVLEHAGYRVVAARSGADALEQARALAAPIDLVVTDVVMPGMNGKELIERLRAEGRARAVLYLSGYTANVIVHDGVLDADIDFLSKPFSPDVLLRAVRRAIARGAARPA